MAKKQNKKQQVAKDHKGNTGIISTRIKQVEERDLTAPTERQCQVEAAGEEVKALLDAKTEIEELQAKLKTAREKLKKTKIRARGSKRYESAKNYASNQVHWALKALSQLARPAKMNSDNDGGGAIARALHSIEKLEAEEERIGIDDPNRLSVKLAELSAPLGDVAEFMYHCRNVEDLLKSTK